MSPNQPVDLRVAEITRRPLCLPFRDRPGRHLARGLDQWQYLDVFEVRLASGHVGYGETMRFYTWGPRTPDVRRPLGRDAAQLMWDDTLGAGLQMALFDAVGRASEVPIHRLLGRRARASAPRFWWAIDMSPEDLAAECVEAARRGYRGVKTKARPWWDLWAQVSAVDEAMPAGFQVQLDFNGMLVHPQPAKTLIEEFGNHPRIGFLEEPLPSEDLDGYRHARQVVRAPLLVHLDDLSGRHGPHPADGFVVSGGVSHVLRAGRAAAALGKPICLQLVGSGITAAFSLHLQAVLEAAHWPAVSGSEIYSHSLLKTPMPIDAGSAPVPELPGLGCEVDRDALDRFEVADLAGDSTPRRLVEVRWPDGRQLYFTSGGVMRELARRGQFPAYSRGVRTRLVPNDGSARWRLLYQDAVSEPVPVSRWAGAR